MGKSNERHHSLFLLHLFSFPLAFVEVVNPFRENKTRRKCVVFVDTGVTRTRYQPVHYEAH